METENQKDCEKLEANAAPFASRLGDWFDAHARPLPWRVEPSLYRTVVSEFMLQQTQVTTVLPYFERWMARFPDFRSLAGAEETAVLKSWEGLGYYSRARNLHKLARQWVAATSKPANAREWQQFPGVGPYTAAAIASIAHHEAVAVVDGNVIRILSRLSNDGRVFSGNSEAVKRLTPLAAAIMAGAGRPGRHNEAMMELGATLCTKTRPQCLLCPVNTYCAGYQAGRAEVLPRLRRRQTRSREVQRALCRHGGNILLQQYPADARRLAGQWELPECNFLGLSPVNGACLLEKSRGIANERIREQVFAVELSAAQQTRLNRHPELHWVPLEKLDGLTLSGPHRRWLAELLAPAQK